MWVTAKRIDTMGQSLTGSRCVAFALSGWWKTQTIPIVLPRSAVGRRKRKTRTETGENMKFIRASSVLTVSERSDSLLFLLSAARRVPPHLLDGRRRNPKRRKRNGIPPLDSYFTFHLIISC